MLCYASSALEASRNIVCFYMICVYWFLEARIGL